MLNKTNIELMKINTALRLSKEALQDKSKKILSYCGIPIVECPFLEEDEGMIVFKDSSWDFFSFYPNDYKKVLSTLDSVARSNDLSRILVSPCRINQIELLAINPLI
jgi:hypothetical protein